MAKKFKFKLEAVLNLKNQNTNEAKDMLSQAVNVRVNKETAISDNKEYLKELSSQNKKMSLQDMQTLHYHKQSVESNIKKLEHEKNQIIEIEDMRRGKLSDAMKEEKILQKLKSRKLTSHNETIKKEEEHFMDEIASRNTRGKD
jgi:flagellar FliJ protein